MRCTSGPYRVTEAQSNTVVVNKDRILSRVVTDRVVLVRQSTKDVKRAPNADNRLLLKTASTPDLATKHSERDDKSNMVEEYVECPSCVMSQDRNGLPSCRAGTNTACRMT